MRENQPSHRVKELTPELQLVFGTCTPGLDLLLASLWLEAPPRDGLNELDWNLAFYLSERERATSILASRLSELRDQGLLPEGHLQALEQFERHATIRRFQLLELDRRLSTLLRTLTSESIPVVLLKGAGLVHSVYPSILDRPMADVDLLLEENLALRVWSMAQDMGWEATRSDIPLEAYDAHHHLPPLTDSSGLGLQLEIHTELFPEKHPFRFGASQIWREARPARNRDGHPGSTVLVPSLEHLLLHSGLHLSWSHAFRFGYWKTFRDIDAIASSGELDWDRLGALAQSSRGETGLFWALHLAREWGMVPLDDSPIESLGRAVPSFVRAPFRRHLAMSLAPARDSRPPIVLSRRLWEAAIRPGQSGHGRIRPWGHSEKWLGPDPSTRPDSPRLGDPLRASLGGLRDLWAIARGPR